MKKIRQIMKSYKESKRSSVTVYVILRVLVIACLISRIFRGNWHSAFLCLLALVMFTLPVVFQNSFKIVLPNTLEIIIFLFIFSSTILGEIFNFYGRFVHWDTMLHTLNGFLCAGIGFALVDLLNENSEDVDLSPLYLALVAFCFSMTIGVVWEFFEHGMDKIFLSDMQKDSIVTTISTVTLDPLQNNNAVIVRDIAKTVMYDAAGSELAVIDGGYLDIGINDTMKDLMVNCVGAVIFSFFGYFYVANRDKYKFTTHFVPQKDTP